jgi:hypothetical protein
MKAIEISFAANVEIPEAIQERITAAVAVVLNEWRAEEAAKQKGCSCELCKIVERVTGGKPSLFSDSVKDTAICILDEHGADAAEGFLVAMLDKAPVENSATDATPVASEEETLALNKALAAQGFEEFTESLLAFLKVVDKR